MNAHRIAAVAVSILFACVAYAQDPAGPPAASQPVAGAPDLDDFGQCLVYVGPLGQVVWEEDPVKAEKLLKDKAYTRLSRLADPKSAIAAHTPPSWASLLGRLQGVPVLQGPRATLFCHERITKAGAHRLVVVDMAVSEANGKDYLGFSTSIFENALVVPKWVGGAGIGDGNIQDGGKASKNMRVYAGQPDGLDPSHFTIVYEIDGKQGVIECWLEDPEPAQPGEPPGVTHTETIKYTRRGPTR